VRRPVHQEQFTGFEREFPFVFTAGFKRSRAFVFCALDENFLTRNNTFQQLRSTFTGD
jgi:hypothetical protein